MTTTTGTPVTCPPSEVHDVITEWAGVHAGDLVIWDGEFRLVEDIYRFGPDDEYLVLLDGEKRPGTIPCGTYAAVRRYDTGEGA